VKRLGEDFYEVAVKDVPEKGRVNARIVELLSLYFEVKKDRIKLVAGKTSKSRLFRVLGEEDQP